MIRTVLALSLLCATPAMAQNAPETAPTAATYQAALKAYMAYIDSLQGTTHTDGWNLDDMKVPPDQRQILLDIGQQVHPSNPQ
ncbi:hypothetical protein [Lichenifustis flavocetrariae]|uniref:DUF885 domain-containing protein n=1 Tax=Lichenifustis flavocetrariae TaxID=2949735 RepID=A0AA42CNC8_9HYPH|nr:hypothetical protein [Lichenifustis flavocetrariae]MCW6512631.1 hypothetical protein [Lichenifustis flavocetrariae]